jgi:hypothetical protein
MRCGYLMMLCAAVTACHARSENSAWGKDDEKDLLLGLVGYNYTDRNISTYTVNDSGGGHVFLSSPDSGGSGVTCCVRISKKSTRPLRVKVRWQYDGCTYLIKNDRTGAADRVRHFYFRETEVDVPRNAREEPDTIETHFYPDGSVQVFLSKDGAAPRLSLDGRRKDKSSFPRCKNDENPEKLAAF